MTCIVHKLRSWVRTRFGARGESLVETLAALLVCSLAVLMFYTAVTSAARMNTQADKQSQLLREEVFAAEMQDAREGASQKAGEVRFSGYGGAYSVTVYSGDNEIYKSYKLS